MAHSLTLFNFHLFSNSLRLRTPLYSLILPLSLASTRRFPLSFTLTLFWSMAWGFFWSSVWFFSLSSLFFLDLLRSTLQQLCLSLLLCFLYVIKVRVLKIFIALSFFVFWVLFNTESMLLFMRLKLINWKLTKTEINWNQLISNYFGRFRWKNLQTENFGSVGQTLRKPTEPNRLCPYLILFN